MYIYCVGVVGGTLLVFDAYMYYVRERKGRVSVSVCVCVTLIGEG